MHVLESIAKTRQARKTNHVAALPAAVAINGTERAIMNELMKPITVTHAAKPGEPKKPSKPCAVSRLKLHASV
jgi:hypothetical protein